MPLASRAQTTFEFIMLISVFLFLVLILAGMNYGTIVTHNNQVGVIKARDAVFEIYKAVNQVYSEGEGAKTKIFINMPNAIEASSIDGGLILVNVSVGGDIRTVKRDAGFPMTGSIPSEGGYYWVNVTSQGSSVEVSHR